MKKIEDYMLADVYISRLERQLAGFVKRIPPAQLHVRRLRRACAVTRRDIKRLRLAQAARQEKGT